MFNTEIFHISLYTECISQLPPDLATRVGAYTQEMFLLTKGYDVVDTLARLPPALQSEIQLCLNEKLLKKVSVK